MSLLNGLSALGSGVASYAATAGAEAQKADAAQALQASGGVIQGGLIAQRGALEAELARQAGVIAAANKTAELNQSGGIAASAASALAETQSVARVQAAGIAAAAPTDAQKNILFYQKMGWIPGGATAGGAASATPSGNAASAAAPAQSSDNSSSGVDAGTWDGSTSQSNATATPTQGAPPQNPATSNPLVRSAMGLPRIGSEDDIRSAIAQQVANDPASANLAAGDQAALIEQKLATSTGKMASPDAIHSNAAAIARYDMEPIQGRALTQGGGAEIMNEVTKLNPDYNAPKYFAKKAAEAAITTGGSLAPQLASMDASMGHVDQVGKLYEKLGNYPAGFSVLNAPMNKVLQLAGAQPIANQIQQSIRALATEGNRVFAGNAGTQSEIDDWIKTFPFNSPINVQMGALSNFVDLVGEKFNSIAGRAAVDLGKDAGTDLMLPKSRAIYNKWTTQGDNTTAGGSASPAAAASSGTLPTAESPTSSTRGAAPTLKPPSIGEVQQGYSFTGGNPADPASWKAVK